MRIIFYVSSFNSPHCILVAWITKHSLLVPEPQRDSSIRTDENYEAMKRGHRTEFTQDEILFSWQYPNNFYPYLRVSNGVSLKRLKSWTLHWLIQKTSLKTRQSVRYRSNECTSWGTVAYSVSRLNKHSLASGDPPGKPVPPRPEPWQNSKSQDLVLFYYSWALAS